MTNRSLSYGSLAPAGSSSFTGLGFPTSSTALGSFGTQFSGGSGFGNTFFPTAAPASSFSGFGAAATKSGFENSASSTQIVPVGAFGTSSTNSSIFPSTTSNAIVSNVQAVNYSPYDADVLFENLPDHSKQKIMEFGLIIKKQRHIADELSLIADDHIRNIESEVLVLKRSIVEMDTSCTSTHSLAKKLKVETTKAARDVQRYGCTPVKMLKNPSGLYVSHRLPSSCIIDAVRQMEEKASSITRSAKEIHQQLTSRRTQSGKQMKNWSDISEQLSKIVSTQHTVLVKVAGRISSTHSNMNLLRTIFKKLRGGDDVFEAADKTEKSEKIRSEISKQMKLKRLSAPSASTSGQAVTTAPGSQPGSLGTNFSTQGFSFGSVPAQNSGGTLSGFGNMVPAPSGSFGVSNMFGTGANQTNSFGTFGTTPSAGFTNFGNFPTAATGSFGTTSTSLSSFGNKAGGAFGSLGATSSSDNPKSKSSKRRS